MIDTDMISENPYHLRRLRAKHHLRFGSGTSNEGGLGGGNRTVGDA